jgi:anti-anti-sigma regulatory factor
MLTSTTHTRSDANVMRLSGVLNARTYQQVRDAVIKVAVDHAAAVIVDVNDLAVRDDASWTAFTSARWHIQQWPQVPIALVAGDPAVRKLLTDLSVDRFVPVYDTVAAATEAIGGRTRTQLHRARADFGAEASSVNASLMFVHEHLVAWSMRDRIPVASTVVNVFAENALRYSYGGFEVRLEGADTEVAIAVSDRSSALAVRRERALGSCLAGLDIVSALCSRWGNTPTSTGKTVWARVGPHDTFADIARPSR